MNQNRFRNYLRFRNYDSEIISSDSETIVIQKLRFRNYGDSETMAIQKLSRFRNLRGSETLTIQKLVFRNYHDSESRIQKLSPPIQKLSWFRNYHDSESTNKKTGFRNYFLQFTQLTRLRTSRFRSSKLYQMPTPHGASNWLGLSTRIRWYQNSHPHGTSNWYWMSMQEKHDRNCNPHGTSNWLGLSTRIRWYQNSTPMELQIDLECPQG